MTLLFLSKIDRAEWWRQELGRRMPGLDIRVWPEVGARDDIEFALVWEPPKGELARYPNLKAIFSLGAGVDHLLDDPGLPAGVPICRVVDRALTAQMSEYVLLNVLRYHRQQPAYARQQAARQWRALKLMQTSERRVGIMGMGVLGQDAAAKLIALGFAVAGWSRTARSVAGVESFHGPDGLAPFLARTEILVCLLPLTPDTEGILNAKTFAHLPAGAALVSAARGGHLVEEDLIPALDTGQLSAASLDVFRNEPLPAEHPFWADGRITITPHVASITDPRSVADLVAENIRRARAGEPFLYVVDTARGY